MISFTHPQYSATDGSMVDVLAVMTPGRAAIPYTVSKNDPVTATDYATIIAAGGIAPMPVQTLAQVQATQIAALTTAYSNAVAMPVSYTAKNGTTKTYQADPASVRNLTSMMLAFQLAGATPAGFYWVAQDNTQVPFAYADLQGLAAAFGTQGAAAFAHLQTQKAAVIAATTTAAVQATGW